MFSRKTLVADLLFWVQVILAFLFSVPQFFKLLENTKGQSLSMQFIMLGFLLLNLSLAYSAHIARPTKTTTQIIAVYVMWTIFVSSNIGAIFWNGTYIWSGNDYVTSILAIIGLIIVLFINHIKKVGLRDSMTKGLLAVVFKATPQFMMALKIFSEGGAGVPMITIIIGNIGVCIRIGQIIISIREAGWDRNRLWLLIAEVSNEISWAIVSFAWLCWFLSF